MSPRMLRHAWLLILTLVGSAFFTSSTEAYQIKRVITGATTAGALEVWTVDLTTPLAGDYLDLNRSFVIITKSMNTVTNTRAMFDVRATIDDDRTLMFARQISVASPTITIEYMVVEFASGTDSGEYDVKVLSGMTTVADSGGTSLTKTVTLPESFTPGKAFPILTYKNQTSTAATDERNLFTAELIDDAQDNKLRIQRLETTGNANVELAYQVVKFDAADSDVSIQSGTTNLFGSAAVYSATATPSPTVTAAKSTLFFTFRAYNTSINGEEEDYMIDGTLNTLGDTLTFSREGGGDAATDGSIIVWYLVEFKNEAFAQSNRIVDTTADTAPITLSATDVNRTFLTLSGSGWTGTAGGTSGLDSTYFRGQLGAGAPTTTTLTWTREDDTVSNGNISWFTIELPLLNIAVPNAGTEVWRVGETQNITWQHAKDLESSGTCGGGPGPGHKLQLELCKDGATCASPLTITTDVCANLDTYPWTIPDTLNPGVVSVIGTTNRVKITDLDYTATSRNFDTSNNNFEIKGTITVTAPNGTETWVVGENRNITWNKTGDLSYSTFELHLSEDGGGSYPTPIATGVTQASVCTGGSCSYAWNPVDDRLGTDRRVRVRLASDPTNVLDTSNANFTIKRYVGLTAPTGSGTTWESKKQYSITWDYRGQTGYGTVKLEYSPNNGMSWYAVEDGQPENAGANALAVNNDGVAAGDNPPFAGKGRFYWKVPDAAISVGQALVRVTSNADPTVQSASAQAFNVNPSIRVDTPNGGPPIKYVDTTESVTWTCSPTSISKVKIELMHSTDGVVYTPSEIVTGYSAGCPSGSYASWAVGDFISAYHKIRLTGQDAGGIDLVPAVVDESDADFTIHGRIDNISLSGGTYTYGQNIPFTWTPHGTIGNVNVKLSSNGGGDGYPTTLNGGAVTGTGGSWTWPTGTTALGSTYKVRVVEVANADVYGDSASNFTLKGQITGITYPNDGTEIFPVGSNQTITWTRSPDNATFDGFQVDYSLNNGAGWTSPNGGTICASASSGGAAPTCAWNNIPATALTTQLRIRVCHATDLTNCRTNDNPAKIRGSLTLTAPLGNANPSLTDLWYIGETRAITWTPAPSVQGQVRLVYSLTGCASPSYPEPDNIIATVASETLSKDWVVPAAAQDEGVCIKVYNVNDPGVTDQSDYDIKIRGGLDVTDPDGGAPFLVVGDPKNITWMTAGSVSSVRVWYSSNSAAGPWTEITSSPVSNINAYLWPSVADAIGTATRVKVQDATYPTTENISGADFEIKGDLVFDPTAPPANAILRVGGNYLAQWTKKGTLTTPTANIKLLYSINDGSSFPDPANVVATVTGVNHNWLNIPDAARSNTVRLKVQWEGDAANIYDVSPQIKIKPSVDLTSPDTGTYHIGDPLPIGFTHTGRSTDTFKVLYSTNNGSTYPDPANMVGTVSQTGGATGALNCSSTVSPVTCTWTIPNVAGIVTTQFKVKTELVGDEANVTDQSANAVTMLGGLDLTYPDTQTGVVWTVGDTKTITWTRQGITSVTVTYTKDNGLDNYANSATCTESGTNTVAGDTCTWVVPAGASDSNQVKFKIKANDTPPQDNVTFATSTNAIRVKPKVTLTYPTGGEVFVVGTSGPDTIKWTYSGDVNFIDIYYTKDTTGDLDADGIPDPAEVNWISIATGAGAVLAGQGGTGYAWPSVPDDVTTTARIVIRKKDDSTVKDVKNAYLKIRGDVALDQPNAAGLQFPIASTYDIKWTPTGTLGNVKLEYSTNGFADESQTFTVMGPGAVSGGNLAAGASGVQQSFTWEIPNAPGTATKVRITNLSDATVTDKSTNAFGIIGSLFMDVPNGPASIWAVGSSQPIQWHKFGAINTVELFYSKNGGADGYPYRIPAGCDPATTCNIPAGPESGSSYAWTIPDEIGDQLRIKIVDDTDTSVSDTSNGDFMIKGTVQVSNPNNSTTRYAGDPLTVSWTPAGSIGPVTIYYSTNGFADELQTTTMVSSYQDVSNAYVTTVPDAISDTVKFRVKSQQSNANLVATDISDFDFAIKGKLTLQALASEYVLGDPVTVQWTAAGSLGNVKVEYFDGAAWNVVTTSAPEDGPYAFTLDTPDLPSGAVVGTNLAKIRITDANDSSVTTESPAFMVKPLLSVGSPASGNTWVVNSAHPLIWTSKGANITNVKIEYASDGGSAYQPVLESEGTPNDGVVTNDGSLTWTVPDEIGAAPNLKLKISTLPTSDPWAVVAYSSGLAQIIGGLAMTTPNDTTGVQWRINSTGNQLLWDATGSIANVKLDYSTNSGGSWSPVVASAPSGAGTGKSYSWNIPGTALIAKDTVRFRVCDAANTNVCDTADAASSLLANFTVVHPLNGDVWVAENTHTIEWSTPEAGVPATVKLEYTLEGTNWNPVPENYGIANDGIVANTGTQNVTLGTALSNAAKGRISDPADANSLLAGTAFKIRGDLTLTSPTTGLESWELATTQPITWTKKGNITAVKLVLSTGGVGGPYPALVDGTTPSPQDTQNIDVTGAGPFTFNWVIPNNHAISTTTLVRVVDANDGTVYDTSDNNFTLKGRVQLANPNGGGGQTLTIGVPFTIDGTVFGPIPTVNLYLSTNGGDAGGGTYTQLANGNCDSVVTSLGSFSCNWNVPDQLGSNMRIQVTDASNGAVKDESDTIFAIKGSVTLSTPAGGAIWYAGDAHDITWTRTGTLGNVDLFYNVNDGSYQTIATAVPSDLATNGCPTAPCYRWTLPSTGIVSANVKVKIDGTNLVAPAISPAFAVKGKLTLTYPDAAGIDRTLGDTVSVTWNVAGDIGPVKVEYFDGSAWSAITTTAPQAGPFALLLDAPNTTVATAAAKVRISDADDATVADESANAFMVRPYLAVNNPAGNEAWVVGTIQNLAWDYKGSNVANVEVRYSKDSGVTYPEVIYASTPNDGAQPWTMPDDIQPTKTMKVKLSTLPLADPYAASAVSTGLFHIVGALGLTTPNDTTGVQWRINSPGNQLLWNATGSIANVKLDYSVDSGSTWSPVAASAPSGAGAGKSYSWNIPGTTPIAKDIVRFRACDAANTNVCDLAAANSSFLADFTVTHPLNGDVWVAENTHTIEWSTPQAGVPPTVKLELSYDNGSNWNLIPESYGAPNDGIAANTGTLNVTLGTPLSNAAKGRISDPADANSALAGTAFKIRGDLALTAPNTGAESWEVGTYNAVTWTKKGAMAAVKLLISLDGGTTYNALVDGDGANTQNINVTGAGPYSFNLKIPDVPGITTIQARLRVMDANDATVYDSSDANFTIKGRVTLATPNGGETLTVGVPYGITGNVFGPIGIVNLYLSTNGGDAGGGTYAQLPVGNCDVVAVQPDKTFSCNWNVPDQLGSNVRIKVTDATNGSVKDESTGTLSIKGGAMLTAPVSGNIWYAGDPHTIVWDRTGTIGNIDLFYNVNDGTWQSIASGLASPLATGNTYSWTLPSTSIVSANVKVKVDGANLAAPFISPAFQVKGKLTLTYPDAAGIVATLGDTVNVTWNVAGDIGPVKVDYYDGSAWSTITLTAPQAGPFGLLLDTPNTTVATTNAKVRISDADEATVTDESANGFMVKPYLLVQSPAGNEAWVVGTNQAITWTRKGTNVTNVELRYSKNSGATYDDIIAASTTNNGAYAWTIPDDIQSVKNMKVKVSTLPLADPYAVTALSTGLFQIVGALEMAVPNDTTGVKWRVGSSANEIKWNATGSVVNVRLEYSIGGVGGPWLPITASTPSGAGANKTYSWNIPVDAVPAKDAFRIRALDAANTNVLDSATANSSLLADFTFVHPLVGEVWVAETSKDIEWTTPTAGVPTNVKLDYTLDGSTFQSITASTLNSGIMSWSIPPGVSPTAKIRISDPNDATDSAKDSATFRIRGDLTMTAPNTGTESWGVDTTHALTWTKKGNILAVKLQFSNDGGVTYDPAGLVDGNAVNTQNIDVTGAGPYTFNWRIPDVPGIITTTARIRVVDANDSTVYDQSDQNFIVKGNVTVTAPNGGQTLLVGNSYTITGNVFGPIPSVKLYYSTDGLTYPNAVQGCSVVPVSAGTFSCNWAVPDELGTSLKIKVEDAGNPLVFDTSDAVFSIKGVATLTAPVTGNIWEAGQQHQIRWDRNGTIGNVDLLYSVGGGAYQPIANGLPSPNPTGNTFDWTLPTTSIVSTNVKVRVSGVNLAAPVDSAAFTVKGKLILNYPDGAGITANLGDTMNITWTVAGDIGPVKVEYYDGALWTTVTLTAPQNGPYGLLLDAPNTTVATAGAKVRISDPDDATVIDESANPFMVKPVIAVTAPVGNEALVVASTFNIAWTKLGDNVATVKLEYSKDGGLNYNDVIVASTSNDGLHPWLISDDIQSVPNMKVRISTLPTSDPYAITAVSGGLFKIVGSLTVIAPQAIDRWGVGTSHDIKWQRTGSVSLIRLTYSTDGSTYNPIADTIPGGNGDPGYSWTIPNVAGIVSPTVTVKSSDMADSSVYDLSDTFSIVPSFTVTAPVLDERVIVSRPYTMTWNRQGLNPTVNLYYSLDGFAGPGISIASGVANTGVYVWTAPDQAGLASGFVTANLRVTYPLDETVYADSPQFRLVAGFTVVAPSSTADKWDVGSSRNVLWTCTSAYPAQAKIEYSTDGGATYPFVIAAGAGNAGAPDAQRSYTWNPMPDTITAQLKVKVSAVNDLAAFDASDSNAKIKAFFQVLVPSGSGLVYKVADPLNITWNWDGTVADVRLDYSLDDFATAVSITPTTPNDGVYGWTIPDAISTNMKVRVRSTTDVDGQDVSDNPFKVEAKFTITLPNGAEALPIGFPQNVMWNTVGNVSAVNLVAYSTLGAGDPGFPYDAAGPYVIASGLANTPNAGTTYAWNPVPDMASPNLKVRVIDAADAAVYDDSDAAFKIQGSYTITYPTLTGEVLKVNDPAILTWNPTGSSITQAKISHSIAGAGGPWTLIKETEEGTPDDGVVTNDGSFTWTVPDVLASAPIGLSKTNVMIKIEDPNDASVFDLSDNPFKVGGRFTVVTPAGGERWVVSENHLVSWNTSGQVTLADVVYSTDNFLSTTAITTGLTNVPSGYAGSYPYFKSYNWTVPDSLSANAKVRVIDANDPNITGDSLAFQIDYYNVTFEVRDLLSNAHITTLNVNATHITTPGYLWAASGQNSPIMHGFQAGPWNATFTQSNYGDQSTSFIADQDQTVIILMETKVVHVWEAISEIAYSAATDTASIATTLKRDGITVSGASAAMVEFFIPGNPVAAQTFSNPTPPDANGFYNFTWTPPTGLNPGIVYNVVTTINLAATGATIKTPRTFSIAQEVGLQNVTNTVNQQLDVPLSQVEGNITTAVNTQLTNQQNFINTSFNNLDASLNTQLNAQTSAIDNSLGQIETNINTQMDAKLGQFDSRLISLDNQLVDFGQQTDTQIQNLQAGVDTGVSDITGAGFSLQINAEKTTATNKQFGGTLIYANEVLLGQENVKIVYQADENLTPTITILVRDANGKEKEEVKDAQMTPVSSQPDMYEYVIKKITAPPYPPGQVVSVIVKADVFTYELDPDKAGETVLATKVGSFQVTGTTLDAIAGSVSGLSGMSGKVSQTLEAARALQATFGSGASNISETLGSLSTAMDKLPAEMKRAVTSANQGQAKQMTSTLNEVAKQIQTLTGDNMGYDMSQIVGKALDESAGLREVTRKTAQVQQATEVTQMLLEHNLGGIDKPVVHVGLQ